MTKCWVLKHYFTVCVEKDPQRTIVRNSKTKSLTFFLKFPKLQLGRRTRCTCCMGLLLSIFHQHLLLAIVGGRATDWL